RVYRKEICPFEVVENFEKEGFQKYDAAYLLPFLEGLAQCYINASVRLSNSMVGEVVMINKSKLSRPVVKVDNHFIDLSKQKELKIASIL
ncbi:MAG TPA: transcriptional regulator, partial [Lachnoclostridium phytofermentans]|nr:transcriptional regulator [Lachnoclostridium phytofermentans]